MKCPMRKLRYKDFRWIKDEDGDSRQPDCEVAAFLDCIGSNCAWWDSHANTCVIKVIAGELANIGVKVESAMAEFIEWQK